MAQLKSADILSELAQESVGADITIPAGSAEQEVSKSEELDNRKKSAKADGAGKPSPYQADLREKLRQKEQFNFGQCPVFVVKEFEKLQKKAKMNKREFLYHLLREAGADIPPYKDMDGRKL